MTRTVPIVILGAFLVVAALGGLAFATLGTGPPVYAVDDVTVGLSQHPQDWVGRTVLVWGRDVRFSYWCGAGIVGAAAAGVASPQESDRGAGTAVRRDANDSVPSHGTARVRGVWRGDRAGCALLAAFVDKGVGLNGGQGRYSARREERWTIERRLNIGTTAG